MDKSTKGISSSFILFAFFISCALSSQLYLQPAKHDNAVFTGDSFFITCFTSDDNIDQLSWTDFETNPIRPKDQQAANDDSHKVHTEPAEGDLRGLRVVFTNVDTEDAGTYTCSDDQSSVTFDLTVNRAVTFSDTPSVQHAPEGEDGIVLCNVKSDPKPVVSWYYKDTKISNNQKYTIHPENHSLRIHNLTRKDAGDYKCKAFVITPLSSQFKDFDIKLHVQYVPEVIGEQKLTSFASVGQTKNLSCTVTADPVPLFQWLNDDMIIHNGTKKFFVFNTQNTSTLQMSVDDEDRFGEYICRASNPLGTKEVVIELKEGAQPGAPQISVVGEDQGGVKLRLTASAEDKSRAEELKVTGFRVEYALAADPWDAAMAQEFSLGDAYHLRNMSYNTDYKLRAAAGNAAGFGPYSEDYSYKTHPLEVAPVIGGASSNSLASAIVILGSSALFFFVLL